MNDRVLKQDYKAFLEGVRNRVNELIAAHKEEIIDTKNPITRQRVATSLQVSVEETQTFRSQEHVKLYNKCLPETTG